MSAEVLRRAAALMRERAEAVNETSPSPWSVSREVTPESAIYTAGVVIEGGDGEVSVCETYTDQEAQQIASWHPAVALLVADWLDTAGADLWAHGPLCCTDGCDNCDDDAWAPHVRRAVDLARAYLGEQP